MDRFDAIAPLAIFVLILPRAWSLLREVVDVLLEATPRGVDLGEVRQHMIEVRGVVDVHDLHAWTITSGMPVLSAHVIVDDECIAAGRSGQVLDAWALASVATSTSPTAPSSSSRWAIASTRLRTTPDPSCQRFSDRGLKPRSRRLLVTTNTDEKAMAAPASIGLSRPAAASGRAATL